jgi:hypothetical protein
MAGPSIVVRVLGDLRGLGQSLEGAGQKAASSAQRAHQAFSGFLGGLNKAGVLGPFGQVLDGIDTAIGNIVDHGKKIGPAMIGTGAAITGVGALLSGLGSKEQASHQQLQAAIQATGHDYSDYGKQIEGAIHHQENFGNSAHETQDALRILTSATNDPAKALRYLNTASDLAAAKHISLSEAATKLGKAYNGNTRVLKEFGIQVTKAGSSQKAVVSASKAAETADRHLADAKRRLADLEAIDSGRKHLSVSAAIALRNAEDKVKGAALVSADAHHKLKTAHDHARTAAQDQAKMMGELGQKLKGQAAASVDTFAGKLDVLKTKVMDQVSAFGQKYGPALQGAGIAIMAFGTISETAGAMAASGELAALWPIALIVAAIIGLVAIGYVLYRNWKTIWGAVRDAIAAVWNWIRTNWPLLLAILTGPIGIAVLLIIRHFDQIRAAGAAVLSWLRSAWNAIVGFFAGVAGRIADAVTGAWDQITGAASAAVGTIKGIWQGLIGWISSLPSRIASAAAGMWHGITDAFRAALNALIDLWDRMHFQIGGWGIGPVHVPTVTVGLPFIPHLAQGGLITSSGIVYAHAGEVISPAPRMGPSVWVENAHFATEVDVEAFMRRAAWSVQTERI